MKNRRTRRAIGLIASVIAFAAVFPAAFWILGAAIDRLFNLPPLFGPPASNIVAGAFWLIGAFWIFWSYSYLVFVGAGSPFEAFGFALEPTKQLVTTGPYAYTRNPAVFGLMWVLAGVAMIERSMGALILLFLVFLIAVLYLKLFEEPILIRRFGYKYEHYRDHVPLLFPRLVTYVKPEAVQTG